MDEALFLLLISAVYLTPDFDKAFRRRMGIIYALLAIGVMIRKAL